MPSDKPAIDRENKSISEIGVKAWLKNRINRERVHGRRFMNWLDQQLWARPVLYCALAISAISICTFAEYLPLDGLLPEVKRELVETLMSVLTASMLGIVTFAVASMVSAFNSVGTNATPRAFSLIVSDDQSKSALSTFIGAFIYGTVGTVALKWGFFSPQDLFAVFSLTILVYGLIVLTLVRWIDAIARLGRMGTAISRVEKATEETLMNVAQDPLLGTEMWVEGSEKHSPVSPSEIGYVQDIDMSSLQQIAEKHDMIIHVSASTGTFAGPGRPVAYLENRPGDFNDAEIHDAFYVGDQRSFATDPRFGFVVLSQIAARALSPGINDPGTAIDVLGSVTRLLLKWTAKRRVEEMRRVEEPAEVSYPRVHYRPVGIEELLENGFGSVAVYGAGQIEVMTHLQRYLQLLASASDGGLYNAAEKFSREAFERAKLNMEFEGDIDKMKEEMEEVLRIVENKDNQMK